MTILRTISRRARNLVIARRFKRLHPDCYVSPKAIIWGSAGISLEAGAQIHAYAVLQCTKWDNFRDCSGSIHIGPGTTVQPFAYLQSVGGSIEIGQMCSINPYCVLQGSEAGLRIGNFVRIAAHTMIVPSNHRFDRVDVPIVDQGVTSLGIVIEDDVWVGAGVKILDGVTVAKGCILAAGCVVTDSTEPYGIYGGVPARKISHRGRKG